MEGLGNLDLMDIVSNRPLFTVCASTLLLLFGLNFVLSDCTERVGLVTANTLITNQYVWNLVTACFYEKYIVKLVFDLVALLFATKALPIPSIEQFGLYFLFSVIACTIGTSTYSFVVFFTMANETSLITPMYGFTGVLIAILMFARHQYRGESVHSAFPKLTYHHLPILLLLTQVVLYFAWCKYLVTDLPFSIVSLFFSWSYLRFYYKHGTGEEWGDKSEDFSFVAMFPEALHIVLIPFTTAFYNIVALVGLFPALDPVVEKKTYHHLRHNSGTLTNASGLEAGLGAGEGNIGGAAAEAAAKTIDVVADRRRAKALKLLDAKMAELAQEPEGWDDVGSMNDLDLMMKNPAELSKYKV